MVCNRKNDSPYMVSWFMERRVGGCVHVRLVSYNPSLRDEAARKLRMARASLRVACEQQRMAIRMGGW